MENSMAKEFKDFDERFKHLRRTDEDEPFSMQEAAKKVTRWECEVERWIQIDVQFAVYRAPDHEEWQKFRVSLKGQSTKMKLLRLATYWATAQIQHREGGVQLKLEKIRVDNYLGALVRGGQLTTDHVVVR